jgi:cell division protein FtsN
VPPEDPASASGQSPRSRPSVAGASQAGRASGHEQGLLAQKRADVIRAKQLFDALGKKRSTLEEVGIRSELLDILHRNAEADLTTMGTDVEKLADMFLEQAKKGFGWDSVTELLDLPSVPRSNGAASSSRSKATKVKTVFDDSPTYTSASAGWSVGPLGTFAKPEPGAFPTFGSDGVHATGPSKTKKERERLQYAKPLPVIVDPVRQASKQAALTTRRTWTPEQREAYNSRWSVGPLGTFAKPEPGAFPTFGSEHASGSEHGSRPRNASGVASGNTTGPSKTKKERERLQYAKPLPVIVDPVRQASKQAALTTRRTWTPEQREAYNTRLEATEAQQKARVVQRKTTIDTLTNRLTRLKQRPDLAPVQRATRAVRSDALAAAVAQGPSASSERSVGRRSVRAPRNS